MIEEKFVRVDGSAVAVEVSAVLLEIHGRKEVQVIARDISDRKRAEIHIQHLNRVYRLLSGTNETIVREKDAQKLFESGEELRRCVAGHAAVADVAGVHAHACGQRQ